MAETFAATAAEENRSQRNNDPMRRERREPEQEIIVVDRKPVAIPAANEITLQQALQHTTLTQTRQPTSAPRPTPRRNDQPQRQNSRPPMRNARPPQGQRSSRPQTIASPVPEKSISLQDLLPKQQPEEKPTLSSPVPTLNPLRPIAPPVPPTSVTRVPQPSHTGTKLQPGQVVHLP